MDTTPATCGEHGAPLHVRTVGYGITCARGCDLTWTEIHEHLDGRTLTETTTGALVVSA